MISAKVKDNINQEENTSPLQKEKVVTQENCRVPNLRDRRTLSRSKALKDFSTPSPSWATSKRTPVTHNSPREDSQNKANNTLNSNKTNKIQASVGNDSNVKKAYQSLKCQEKRTESILQGRCLLNNNQESLHATSTGTDIKIICYMCNSKLVYGDDVVNHLLFSPLRCKFCKDKISSCSNLKQKYTSPCRCPERSPNNFPHDYSDWDEPLEHLDYFIEMDLSMTKYLANITTTLTQQQIKVALEAYMLTLLPIRALMPWKTAFRYFADHICTNSSEWPPPLPRLGWVICSESSTVQNRDKVISKCTSDMSENRKRTAEPLVKKVTLTPSHNKSSVDNTGLQGTNSSQLLSSCRKKVALTPSHSTISVDNTGLHGTISSQPLKSNTSSTGQQDSHQGVVRTTTTENKGTRVQPSLPFKSIEQSFPKDCPSKPTEKVRETSVDEVRDPSCQRDKVYFARSDVKDIGSPAGYGKESGLHSFRKKAIATKDIFSPSGIGEEPGLSSVHKKAIAAKDIGSPAGNGEASDLPSFCKKASSSSSQCFSSNNKHGSVQDLEKPVESAGAILERCVSPDLYNNESKFSPLCESPSDDIEKCLTPLMNDLNFADVEQNNAESVVTKRECTSSVNFEPDEPNTLLSGVGVEGRTNKNSSHHITTESDNSDSTNTKMIKQPDRSEFSSSPEAKQQTCSKSVSSPVVKQPDISRPVIIQDFNESDSLKLFCSQLTSLPNGLQLESTVVVKETHSSNPVSRSASVVSQDEESTNDTVHLEPTLTPKNSNWPVSDSRKSISLVKRIKKRKSKKMLWSKVKFREKNYKVISEGDEDGCMKLKMMRFVTQEDRDSERFLLISWPGQPIPEECPDCYCILTSELITVNTLNLRIGKVTCPDCKLSIYIDKTSPA